MLANVAVTGLGAVSAIGLDINTMRDQLRGSHGGIRPIASFSTENLSVQHAAEIRHWPAADYFAGQVAEIDRTAQFAIVAARQAVADAGLTPQQLASGRVALVFGICGGGIGSAESPGLLKTARVASRAENLAAMRRTTAFAQTDAVAAALGIVGPRLTISTACASSTSALAAALTLLRAGRADAVVVGGADAWSAGTYAGFYSLGAMAQQPSSPFSRDIGVTFGEGGGCVVLESLRPMNARGAKPRAWLLGCGCTADAHHITSPNPSGEGLFRAMQLALADADVPAAAISYVNAHGTGTLDNDAAETVALHRFFAGGQVPPVSSTKSFFGHTLGAAGILEFIVAVIGMEAGFAPATLNFTAARQGCDLDYIPNQARMMTIDGFMSMSAAFGGINAVAIGRSPHGGRPSEMPVPDESPALSDAIVVSGVGIVSPLGHGIEAFRAALNAGACGIAPQQRFAVEASGCNNAALVDALPLRRLAPTADLRRADNITRFAVVAATLALQDAGLTERLVPERTGLYMAMSEGPSQSIENFSEALEQAGIAQVSARYFPPVVLSTVGGMVSQACRLRGANFTAIDGVGAGLHALAHACDTLRQHPELDAIVVVAADEVARVSTQMLSGLGLLSDVAAPYAASGHGFVPGEGAVALVIERASACHQRHQPVYGQVAGVGLRGEATDREAGVDPTGDALASAASAAMGEAGGTLPGLVYGLSRGVASHDGREAAALLSVLGEAAVPVSGLSDRLGLAEASSGLYAAVAALLALRYGEAWPLLNPPAAADRVAPAQQLHLFSTPLQQPFSRTMALGSSQHGNSAAIVFTTADERRAD